MGISKGVEDKEKIKEALIWDLRYMETILPPPWGVLQLLTGNLL